MTIERFNKFIAEQKNISLFPQKAVESDRSKMTELMLRTFDSTKYKDQVIAAEVNAEITPHFPAVSRLDVARWRTGDKVPSYPQVLRLAMIRENIDCICAFRQLFEYEFAVLEACFWLKEFLDCLPHLDSDNLHFFWASYYEFQFPRSQVTHTKNGFDILHPDGQTNNYPLRQCDTF